MDTAEEKFKTLMKYFLDAFSIDLLIDNKTPKDWKEERAKFYFEKLIELHLAIDKIERYEIYFSEFYPNSEKINEAEAIEYHWHSYIHDFYILQERSIKIIGSLKNDISRYEIANPEDARDALEHLKQQIVNSLKKASEIRTKLSHDFTVRDLNLTKAKTLQVLKQQNQELGLDIKKIDERYEGLIKGSKKEYVEMAAHNKKGMLEMKSFFAPRFGYIFASLNDHDTSIFKM